jgi:hypothetical protein
LLPPFFIGHQERRACRLGGILVEAQVADGVIEPLLGGIALLLEAGALLSQRLQLILIGIHLAGIAAGERAFFGAVLQPLDVVVEPLRVVGDPVDVLLLRIEEPCLFTTDAAEMDAKREERGSWGYGRPIRL